MAIGKGGKEIIYGALGLAGGAGGEAAALKKGGFAVVWTNFVDPFSGATKDGLLTAIAGRLTNKAGKAKGKVFEANRSAEHQQTDAQVAADDKGGFVVAWTNVTLDGRDNEAEAQAFNAKGKRVGKELRLSTTSEDQQSRPELTPLKKGGVLASWEDERNDAPGAFEGDVYAREISPRGKMGRERKLLDGNVLTPSIERLKDGKFALAYDDLSRIDVHLYSKTFKLLAEHELGSLVDKPQVVALKKGGFVVLWETDEAGAGNGNGAFETTIVAQRFDKKGKPVGKLIAVPEDGRGDEQDFDAAAYGAGFAVAWTDEDRDGLGIRARAFDAKGRALGKEIKVNTTETGDQAEPFVAEGKGGRLLIGWTDASGGDGRAPSEIVGRVFKSVGKKKRKRLDDDDDLVVQDAAPADEALRATTSADLFVFGADDGRNVVRRFDPEEDRLAVSADRFGDLDVDEVRAGVRVAFDDTVVVLRGVEADELSRDGFLFG